MTVIDRPQYAACPHRKELFMKFKHALAYSLSVGMLLSALAACSPADPPADTTAPSDTAATTVGVTTDSATDGTTEAVTEAATQPVTEAVTDTITEAVTDAVTEPETEEKLTGRLELLIPKRAQSKFKVICDGDAGALTWDQVGLLCYYLEMETGVKFTSMDSERVYDQEIVLGSANRPETAEMMAELDENDFAIRVKVAEDGNGKDGQIFIAAHSYHGYCSALEYLVENFYTPDNNFAIPTDLNVTEYAGTYNLITSSLPARDPCIVVKDGVYYAYRTGWNCLKNTSGNLEGPWENLGMVAQITSGDDAGDHWAPEVHEYNGYYYMFTTYRSSVTGHRGCTILRADSPEGPFVQISDGHVTPADWDSIDGTLYVDPEGQPWMVFVHEWTSMPDENGSFAAAKLSEDLTHFISEPIELFKAYDAEWATFGVTDGCWMYTTESGDLLMLWSNNDEYGYCIGVARSSNGRLDGEWIQEDRLFSRYMDGTYDGGHAMIFADTDGQMYLSFHSPNGTVGDRTETAVFLPIREEDNRLVWDTDANQN